MTNEHYSVQMEESFKTSDEINMQKSKIPMQKGMTKFSDGVGRQQ